MSYLLDEGYAQQIKTFLMHMTPSAQSRAKRDTRDPTSVLRYSQDENTVTLRYKTL